MAWQATSHTKELVEGVGVITVTFTDGARTKAHKFRADFVGATVEWLRRQVREFITYLTRLDQIAADAAALIAANLDITPADPDPPNPTLTEAQINFVAGLTEMRRLARFAADGGTLNAQKTTRLTNLRTQLSAALDATPALWLLV